MKNPDGLDKIKELAINKFKKFDTNHDNYLDLSEFGPAFKAMKKLPDLAPEAIQKAMDFYDKNHDGKISKEEFQELVIIGLQYHVYLDDKRHGRIESFCF